MRNNGQNEHYRRCRNGFRADRTLSRGLWIVKAGLYGAGYGKARMGWLTGIEPAATGVTILRSTN